MYKFADVLPRTALVALDNEIVRISSSCPSAILSASIVTGIVVEVVPAGIVKVPLSNDE